MRNETPAQTADRIVDKAAATVLLDLYSTQAGKVMWVVSAIKAGLITDVNEVVSVFEPEDSDESKS